MAGESTATVAPTTAGPCGSVKRPETVPVGLVCGRAGTARSAKAAASNVVLLGKLDPPCPRPGRPPHPRPGQDGNRDFAAPGETAIGVPNRLDIGTSLTSS